MQRIRKKGRLNNTWHFGMQDFKERGNIIATFLVHLLPDGTSTYFFSILKLPRLIETGIILLIVDIKCFLSSFLAVLKSKLITKLTLSNF